MYSVFQRPRLDASNTIDLFQAIKSKNARNVKEILAQVRPWVSLNSALCRAVKEQNEEIVSILLENGIDVHDAHQGMTSLQLAIKLKNANLVRILLGHGAFAGLTDIQRMRTLEIAIESEQTGIVSQLVNLGINLNQRSFQGQRLPLIQAIIRHSLPMVRVLLDSGAKPNANGYRNSPLSVAIQENQADIVDLLIQRGADVHQNVFRMYTTLQYSIWHSDPQVSLLLLRKGVDPNMFAGHPLSPLQMSMSQNKPSLTRMLLEYGANPNMKFMFDKSPLQTAIECPGNQFALHLIEFGSDPTQISSSGESMVHIAASLGKLEVVRALYEQGAPMSLGESLLATMAFQFYSADENQRELARFLMFHQEDMALANKVMHRIRDASFNVEKVVDECNLIRKQALLQLMQ